VPFVARWPERIPAGRVSDEIICLTDLMATCAALTAQTLPNTAGEDSVSILPVLLDEPRAVPLREATVHHSHEGTFAIRMGHWKLVDGHGGGDFTPRVPFNARHYGAYRFFDLREDPTESINLCWQHPDTERRLLDLLDSYRERGRSRA
jgi:arylsulfatase A-like enzyme